MCMKEALRNVFVNSCDMYIYFRHLYISTFVSLMIITALYFVKKIHLPCIRIISVHENKTKTKTFKRFSTISLPSIS